MVNIRSKALTQHMEFLVPLEGTAVAIGILGVAAGSVAVSLLRFIGLDSDPLPTIKLSFLAPMNPGGFLFTFWRWTPPVHWLPTLLLELVLWALVGVAISRIVITRVTRDEPMGIQTALTFAASRFTHSLLFFAMVTGISLVLALPFLIPTVMGLIPGIGVWLGSLSFIALSPFLFLFALFGIATLLAGFPVGYLFMPAALSALEGPFLDCVSRAVGYAFARPFLFLWDMFKVGIFAFALYFIGTDILPWVVRGLPTLYGIIPWTAHPGHLSWLAEAVHKIIMIVIRITTGGFVVAYVFGAGTLIYLNMRQEVDGIEFAGPGPDDPEPGAEA